MQRKVTFTFGNSHTAQSSARSQKLTEKMQPSASGFSFGATMTSKKAEMIVSTALDSELAPRAALSENSDQCRSKHVHNAFGSSEFRFGSQSITPPSRRKGTPRVCTPSGKFSFTTNPTFFGSPPPASGQSLGFSDGSARRCKTQTRNSGSKDNTVEKAERVWGGPKMEQYPRFATIGFLSFVAGRLSVPLMYGLVLIGITSWIATTRGSSRKDVRVASKEVCPKKYA